MTIDEIKQRVRLAIDEVSANKSGFIDETEDQQNLDKVIQDKISYALLYILRNAPKEQLSDTITALDDSCLTANSSINSDTLVCTIILPEKVIRVLSARMASWKYAPSPIEEDSQQYLMQSNTYTKGCIDRPVTAIIRKGGKLCLEMYCAKDTNDKPDISVIYKPDYTKEQLSDITTDIAVPQKYEGAFIYQIAGLAMLAQREEIANSLLAISKNYLFEK